MKTLRLVGMALFAVLMCVNFAACSSDDDDPTEESTTDLSKAIIGTWVQDGDDDVMVIKSDKTVTWYENESDYKQNIIADYYNCTWEIKGDNWLYFYREGKLEEKLSPMEVHKDYIIWKEYDEWGDNSDSYGTYNIWTWERYSK